MSAPQLVLITGLSGSGKSTVAKCFEDLGFYCIDNLPLPLLSDLLADPQKLVEGQSRVAVVTDVRAPGFKVEFPQLVQDRKNRDFPIVLLFLEASEEILVKRFSETRRTHPLAPDRPVLQGIQQERELMAEIRGLADIVFDTSGWTIHDARSHIFREFAPSSDEQFLPVVSVVSFGFKHGIPAGTNLLYDVRFLPNPHFVPELKPLSGKDAAVRQFLEEQDDYDDLVSRIEEFLLFALPRFKQENRAYLAVGIGCTGGRHRSVAVAEALASSLSEAGWSARVLHRDIDREAN